MRLNMSKITQLLVIALCIIRSVYFFSISYPSGHIILFKPSVSIACSDPLFSIFLCLLCRHFPGTLHLFHPTSRRGFLLWNYVFCKDAWFLGFFLTSQLFLPFTISGLINPLIILMFQFTKNIAQVELCVNTGASSFWIHRIIK